MTPVRSEEENQWDRQSMEKVQTAERRHGGQEAGRKGPI